jgi:tellurium resistance protein TerD
MAEVLNLTKGQKIDLTKGNPGLKSLKVGLGWDINKGNGSAFDLDAFVICLDDANKALPGGVLYYGSPKNSAGKPAILSESLVHSGDNLTGAGDGEDEVITINLDQVPANVSKCVVGVNIYEAQSRGQNFGMVRNAFCCVHDGDTNADLCKYDLGEDYSTFQGVVFGEVYRHNGEWKFSATSNGFNGTIQTVLEMY